MTLVQFYTKLKSEHEVKYFFNFDNFPHYLDTLVIKEFTND